jgi:DNA polymerase (family 10)
MTNKEIANAFAQLAELMEFYEEESYKIRSYSNAYRVLRAVEHPLSDMSLNDLKALNGVGDAIANKILELVKNGRMRLLDEYLEKTPVGIVALLGIKGLGVKKVQQLWKDLGIESPGELLYACNENRLSELKGFGQKTQQNLKEQIEYYFQSLEKYRWASVEKEADDLLDDLSDIFENVSLSGAFKQLNPVLEAIDFVAETDNFTKLTAADLLNEAIDHGAIFEGRCKSSGVKVKIHKAEIGYFGEKLLENSSNESLYKFIKSKIADCFNLDEKSIFEQVSMPFIPYELRDIPGIEKLNQIPDLIKTSDIKGVVHAHSDYSDGLTTLKELADYVRSCGFSYLGITDHSQSAFYANGLKPDRVLKQWEEIDILNKGYNDFIILKGIESDIKNDGELDYDDEILEGFDFIIASIHSNLKMPEEKATARLIKAIENPYTSMLGHPTGRLLLARQGYPIDHKKVIDACAANKVVIEINSNPLRLDLDYKYLPYAIEKGVKISINPDAHSKEGVQDIRYGVQVARKGLLTAENCINSFNAPEFLASLKK